MWQDIGMAKRPRDPNQLAKLIVDIATGETEDPLSDQKRSGVRRGQAGGLKGGLSRASKLTDQQKRTIAIKAADARWHGKVKGE